MTPIGYYYYVANWPQPLDLRLGRDRKLPERSAIDTAGHDHDMALGVLLMTVVAAVPVLPTSVFLLLFKF